jgi:sugar-specific transcriptional regulator TrmB
MNSQEALKEWGLNDKEREIYTTLLKRGQSTVQDLAKHTGILRQSIYDTLTKLTNQGLISEITENNKTHFTAASPEKLKEILNERKELIDQALPELLSLKKSETSSLNVQIFRGLKAIKSIFSDPLTGAEILSIQPAIGEEFMKDFYVENFVQKRLEKKIPIKIIRESTKEGLQQKITTNQKEFRQARTVKSLKDINTHIIIYNNKVMLNVYREEPASILIEDHFIADSFRLFFNALWSNGKKA